MCALQTASLLGIQRQRHRLLLVSISGICWIARISSQHSRLHQVSPLVNGFSPCSPLGWCSFPNPPIFFPVQCLRRTFPLVGATSEGPSVVGISKVGGFLWASEASARRPLVCSEQPGTSGPISLWRLCGWLVGGSGIFEVALEQSSIGECC